MRAVAFAYHNMGVVGLTALARHGFELAAVYSHHDDPGEEIWFQSVEDWCQEHNVPVSCVEDVNRPEEVERIRGLRPDIIFSFYYRRMLKPAILEIPPRGCLNLHGSLLPRYRGRAPVNWAIVHGETETGVTLHYMVAKPDAGEIVGQQAVPIAFEDTALTLFGKMERAAAELLDRLLPLIREGREPRRPNPIEQGSYFGGRQSEDGQINWQGDAIAAYNLVRAVTKPYPGAFGFLDGEKILIWWARPTDDRLPAGKMAVIDGRPLVGCGRGALEVIMAERDGKWLEGPSLLAFFYDHREKRLT
jgi:UDP-4-amino-4-deoxy-L-arabinose formyltransferase/UDP-glucuronic acid dehydrogenase (UDP-4-keto-hexauronic acid decarboxylating)